MGITKKTLARMDADRLGLSDHILGRYSQKAHSRVRAGISSPVELAFRELLIAAQAEGTRCENPKQADVSARCPLPSGEEDPRSPLLRRPSK
jgi:hypothetical protein